MARGRYYTFQVYKDKSGADLAQIPASGVDVDVYKTPVWVDSGSGSIAGGGGTGSFTVHDLGELTTSDILFRLQPTLDQTITLSVTGINASTRTVNVTNTGGSAVTVSSGEVLASSAARPATFKDAALLIPTAVANKVTTDSRGYADVYIDKDHISAVYSGGGITAIGQPVVGSPGNKFRSSVRDIASEVAWIFDTFQTLTTAGGKIISFRTGGVEKLFIDKDGRLGASGGVNVDTINIATLLNLTGTLTLPVGSVETADFAAEALVKRTQAVASASITLTTAFQLVTGVQISSYTPFSAGSVLLFLAQVTIENADGDEHATIEARIRNTTDATTVARTEVTIEAASTASRRHTATIIASLTGLSSAKTFELQVLSNSNTTMPTTFHVVGEDIARMILIEIKK